MGTLFVDKLDPQSGTSLELGSSGDTVAVNTGATTNLAGNVTLGASGKTITVPAGATITNNGTQTGFGGTNTPNFSVTRTNNQTGVSDNTDTKIQFNNVQYDTASGWDSSNYYWVVPSGQQGKYYISWSAYLSGGGFNYMEEATLYLYGGDGTDEIDVTFFSSVTNHFDNMILKGSGIYSLSAGDKINCYAKVNVDGGTARIDGSGTWDYTHLQLAKIIE